MSGADDARRVARVLRRTGLGYPRGVLGEETVRLAEALEGPGGALADLDARVGEAAAALWPELRASTEAALRRHLATAQGGEAEDLRAVLVWAGTDDAVNPLARALAVRAAQELAAAVARAAEAMRNAEQAIAQGGESGALAAARAVGVMVAELLDLDPEDYAPEVVAYVDAGEDARALDELARATGDEETRAWAREAVRAMAPPDAPAAAAAVRSLAQGEPPDDPAQDAVWVP
ncbi:MAG TPA: hypothetical protein VNT51_08770, partial [Miltoncostaeaceae bacterium]|nr:hypothetical protein [Miltoncostaeaceae bacterium]